VLDGVHIADLATGTAGGSGLGRGWHRRSGEPSAECIFTPI
jgi:hypothetical protein